MKGDETWKDDEEMKEDAARHEDQDNNLKDDETWNLDEERHECKVREEELEKQDRKRKEEAMPGNFRSQKRMDMMRIKWRHMKC